MVGVDGEYAYEDGRAEGTVAHECVSLRVCPCARGLAMAHSECEED